MPRVAFIRPLVVAVILPLVVAGVRAQQAQRGAGQPAAPQGPLAPEKYKDIKVMTDVPADQLELTMSYFVAATGLQCNSCHVRDQDTGVFHYEQDTRTKTTARSMINLVKTVNAGDFGARINCGTCHQGRNQPAGLQPAQMLTPDQLAQMAAQQAAAAARQGGAGGGAPGGGAPGGAAGAGRGGGAQQPALPVLDDVLNKYLAAIGGADAAGKLQSIVMSGTLSNRAAQSLAFTIEEKGAKYRETVQTQPDATTRAFDGTAGWASAGPRVTDLPVFVLQQVARYNELRLPVMLKEKYTNLAPARVAPIPSATPGGTPTQVNALRGSANGVTETFIFDAASGLLIRRTIRTATALNGALNEQVDYADYRDVAGVKMPFEIKRTNWNTLDTLKIADVKANAPVDDSRFTKPR